MIWYDLDIRDHLTTRRLDVHRERLGNRAILVAMPWNVLTERLDLNVYDAAGDPLLQGEPLHLWRNLAAGAGKLPGWQIVASRADGKRTYTRDEIPELTLRVGIPESTEEINAEPVLTVGVSG